MKTFDKTAMFTNDTFSWNFVVCGTLCHLRAEEVQLCVACHVTVSPTFTTKFHPNPVTPNGKITTKIRQTLGGGYVNPTLFPKSNQNLTVLTSKHAFRR